MLSHKLTFSFRFFSSAIMDRRVQEEKKMTEQNVIEYLGQENAEDAIKVIDEMIESNILKRNVLNEIKKINNDRSAISKRMMANVNQMITIHEQQIKYLKGIAIFGSITGLLLGSIITKKVLTPNTENEKGSE